MIARMLRFAAAGSMAALAALPQGAYATSAMLHAAVDNCQNSALAPDARITACTELLRTNLFIHQVQAKFLLNRAVAYRDKGDTADEVADVKQALSDNPGDQSAIELRDEVDRQTPGTIPAGP